VTGEILWKDIAGKAIGRIFRAAPRGLVDLSSPEGPRCDLTRSLDPIQSRLRAPQSHNARPSGRWTGRSFAHNGTPPKFGQPPVSASLAHIQVGL